MLKVTKFIALYVFMTCLLAISCSKKSDPTPTIGCLITKSTLSYSGGSQVSVYEYDGNGILTRYTLTIANTGTPTVVNTFTYAYANGAVSSITQAVQGGATTVANWTVDANNRVAKITIGTGTPPTTESTYTYDSDGNLKSWISKTGPATVTFSALFGSGQLQSTNLDYNSPNSVFTQPYTFSGFDKKNAPYALLATATGQKFFTNTVEGNINPEFLFKSNPAADEWDLRTSSGQNTHSGDAFTYEYNAKNYPTKITRLQTGTSTPTVTTFEYSNCN